MTSPSQVRSGGNYSPSRGQIARASKAIWQRIRGRTDLTREEFISLFEGSTHCALTGIEFTAIYNNKFRPWKPPFNRSVDQIVSGEGYYRRNIQIICNIANGAKGEYSMEEVRVFCKAFLEKNGN